MASIGSSVKEPVERRVAGSMVVIQAASKSQIAASSSRMFFSAAENERLDCSFDLLLNIPTFRDRFSHLSSYNEDNIPLV